MCEHHQVTAGYAKWYQPKTRAGCNNASNIETTYNITGHQKGLYWSTKGVRMPHSNQLFFLLQMTEHFQFIGRFFLDLISSAEVCTGWPKRNCKKWANIGLNFSDLVQPELPYSTSWIDTITVLGSSFKCIVTHNMIWALISNNGNQKLSHLVIPMDLE